jgi:Domain of unknown function (DUF1707)
VTTGPQDPVAGRGRLRAGHADREQAIEALKTAFVDGRLTQSELAARTGRALAARTYADLAALTADIPAEPAAAEPVTAVPARAVPAPAEPAPPRPGPTIRRPLAKAAAASGACLVIATAAIRMGFYFDPGGAGPDPHHSWAKPFVFLAFVAFMAALSVVVLGVATSIEQRRSRRQLPPRPGPGGDAPDGHAPDGERRDGERRDGVRRDGTGHKPVPPGPRTDETRTDLRLAFP